MWGLQPPPASHEDDVRARGWWSTESISRLHSRRYTAAQQRNGRRAAVAGTVAVHTVSCGGVYHVALPAGIRTRA